MQSLRAGDAIHPALRMGGSGSRDYAQTCLFIFVSRRWGLGIRTAVCLTLCVYV